MFTGVTVFQSVVMSPNFGVWGEEAGDGFVDVGEPDGLGFESVLGGEVEPAVSGDSDPSRRRPDDGLVSCMRAPAAR